MQASPALTPVFFLSCAVFVLYLLLLVSAPEAMFIDPDTYWHIATGDVIRSLGALPEHDSWSFTAGSERWYNIAWAWDVAVSYIHQHGGWYGLVVANGIVIALILALLFANCLIHTGEGISAFFATLLFSAVLCYNSIRPHQISSLCIAAIMMLLTQVTHERMSRWWLALIPMLMAAWVNLHGGFIIMFVLLGVFGLDAMLGKRQQMMKALVITGVASLAACLLNPYGIGIIDGVSRTFASKGGAFIQEWQPFTFSFANITTYYLIFFVFMVMMRPLPLPRSEKWIGYVWFVLGLSSLRNLSIFGIVSTPLLAIALQHTVFSKAQTVTARPEWIERLCALGVRMIHNKIATAVFLAFTIVLSASMFSPTVQKLYNEEHLNPLPELGGELHYLKEHYPHARLMNGYNLGGPLIFITRGAVPVWIDGRARTAYPNNIISDYLAVRNASDGWTDVFDRYQLDGVIVDNSDQLTIDRFVERKGWHLAFKGETATIFMRDRNTLHIRP